MSDDSTASLAGGVTRVQHGAPGPDTTPQASDILRGGVAEGGMLRLSADGSMQQSGITRFNSGRDLTSDTIMDTVRTASGAMPAKVEDHHIITANGMSMTVGQAIRMGWLERTSEYQVRETGAHRTEREELAQQVAAHRAGDDAGNVRSPVTTHPTLGQSLTIA